MTQRINHGGLTKNDLIVNDLRHRIVSGALLPGDQIANRIQLEETFQASPATIQKALDRLSRDGFVRAYGRRGTFVANDPPHLCDYALVFEDHPQSGGKPWSRFNSALLGAAIAEGRSSELRKGDAAGKSGRKRRIKLYYDIQPHADVEDYQRLVADIKNHRLAGIIYVTLDSEITQTELSGTTNLPQLCLNTVEAPQVSSVLPDQAAFVRKALDYLKSQGRSRVAMVSAGLTSTFYQVFAAEVAARGMTTRPYWSQGPFFASAPAIRNTVHLLMNPGQNERPDSLIISDDHLVEQGSQGLLNAGVLVPEDVSVVAYANFPFPPTSSVKVKWLGFDIRDVLTTAMNLIDEQRRGRPAPKTTLIPPVFEEEVHVGNELE